MGNGPRRITDDKGNTILASVWSDLLIPSMTIIVDTCSEIAISSPDMFEVPRYPRTSHRRKTPTPSQQQQQRNRQLSSGYARIDSSIIAECVSEDSAYENARVVSPLGQVGDSLAYAPPIGSLKARPEKSWEGWAAEIVDEKRNTSVSMFVGRRTSVGPLVINKTRGSVNRESAKISPPPRQRVVEEKPRFENQAARENSTRWARVKRILMCARKGARGTPTERRCLQLKTPEPVAHLPAHGKPPIAKRRGAATPTPVLPGRVSFDFPAPRQEETDPTSLYLADTAVTRKRGSEDDGSPQNADFDFLATRPHQLRSRFSAETVLPQESSETLKPRSSQDLKFRKSSDLKFRYSSSSRKSSFRKSSSANPVSPPTPPPKSAKRTPNKLTRPSSERIRYPTRPNPHHQRSTSLQCTIISPPIPKRPEEGLGLAQYRILDNIPYKVLHVPLHEYIRELDGLPKQRYACSPFPPQHPVRSPVEREVGSILPEADRRPVTCTPLIRRRVGAGHVRSASEGALEGYAL